MWPERKNWDRRSRSARVPKPPSRARLSVSALAPPSSPTTSFAMLPVSHLLEKYPDAPFMVLTDFDGTITREDSNDHLVCIDLQALRRRRRRSSSSTLILSFPFRPLLFSTRTDLVLPLLPLFTSFRSMGTVWESRSVKCCGRRSSRRRRLSETLSM